MLTDKDKLTAINDSIYGIKEDFEWACTSATEVGQHLMIKSLHARFKYLTEIFGKLVSNLEKEGENK